MRWASFSLLALGLLVPDLALAQFNPQGRRKPGGSDASSARPAPKPPSGGRPSAPKSTPAPPTPSPRPAGGAPNDDAAPSPEILIQRYTQAVLNQPGSEFPLRRLAELARQRDGNLDRLLAEFEERASAAPGRSASARAGALVALGGLYEQAARSEDAQRAYREASELDPKGTVAPLALARLLDRSGDRAGARAAFERVLPKVTGNERELLLRDLMRLCLDTKDFEGAKRYHQELVRQAQGSMYVRAELGRELSQRGEHSRAVAEFREVAAAARGDNRALGPALRDLGAALLGAGESREAIGVLRQARTAAAGQPGLQREIDELLVNAHRREGRLVELVREFEKSSAGNFDRLRTLGRLHEEMGAVDKALEAYRRALAVKKADVELRLKVVQLLELQGELDQALREYQELVRAHPNDAALVFRFAEALLGRGERARALEHLDRLERASQKDEDTLVALTDFYERVGETERASRVLARLSSSRLSDPRHLIELGSRHWRDGKREEALRTWNRILTVQKDRARALVTLGEVYLDHDLTREALTALREAVNLRPTDLRMKRSLAVALERVGAAASPRERTVHWDEAKSLWEELLKGVSRDPAPPSQAMAREARQHIVKLWQRMGQLGARLSPLALRLQGTPPDLEAGRLLAEAELHLREYARAEKTLRLVVREAPGDVTSLLALERALIAQEKRDEAIEVLSKLIAADPQRARDYYQRSARYAAEQYQDERAIRFAVRAVELSPDDAEGHLRLGEMYRKRQEIDLAIASFRQAIAKNERLYPAYFDLAELLVSRGEEEEADRWLRRVVRSATDDEFIARAARLSLQLNLSRGTLTALEGDLLPLALGRPDKPLYRRLLVEVYSTQAFPLVHRLGSADREERQEAAEQLARLGERAVKPLLDALGDERPEQQRAALELLTHVRVRGAAPALLAYAAGEAPAELRERAVLAAGAARDEGSLPKLEALIFDGSRARVDGVAIAAAWAIARLDGRAVNAARERLIDSGVSELRTLGILSKVRAALRGDDELRRRTLRDLERLATTTEAGPWPRAAAAYGLGVLGRPGQGASGAQLVGLLDSSDPLVQAHALAALAELRNPVVEPALADALTSTDSVLRAAALRAAARYAGTPRSATPALPLETPPSGSLDVARLLHELLPAEASAEDALRAFVRLREPLEEAALLAIRSSGPRAVSIAQALTARDGAPAFGALTEGLSAPVTPGSASAELRAEAERAARAITERVSRAYEALLVHDSTEVRSASVSVLGLVPDDDAARSAVLAALGDSAPSVQHAALAALGRSPHPKAREALVTHLAAAQDWRLRRGAAEALGRSLQRFPDHPQNAQARAALERARGKDPFALVRQAAADALSSTEASAPVTDARGAALDRAASSALK